VLTLQEVEKFFMRSSGDYVFARWGRPIAPVVFGTLDENLVTMKTAVEAVCLASGHTIHDLDPDIGSNLMFFFFADWIELRDVPDLDQIIPNLEILLERLQTAKANQYRIFRFDETGAIKACFVFLKMDDALNKLSAESLAMAQVVKAMLLWSDMAFQDGSPLVVLENGATVISPEVSAILKAAYDPTMPPKANDSSHALRIAARVTLN
jgi:hypothetical protein